MIEQLLSLADVWSAATNRSRARLSTIVANNGGFFDQVQREGASCTVATFEKFLSFFRDGANWPDGRIPEQACELLDNFSNIATAAAASPGTGDDDTAAQHEEIAAGDVPPHACLPAAGETGAVEGKSAAAPVEPAQERAA